MTMPEVLWRPSAERVERAGITRFRRWLQETRGLGFNGYEALWNWSVEDLAGFWRALHDWSGVIAHAPATRVLAEAKMPGARWFEGETLNYAEHLLERGSRSAAPGAPAIVFESEVQPRIAIGWDRLRADTGALTATLRRLGVERGDRCVAFLPNIPQAVIALLATTSVGAIWSSASPDMGPVSVLDRFRQIEPKVLFAVDGYRYGGKDFDRRAVVRELVQHLPSLRAVVFVPYLDAGAALEDVSVDGTDGERRIVSVMPWSQALAEPAQCSFEALPFDHPLWIVYSSGTTGMPKPIVHGHGGFVLETLKTNLLHLDVQGDDRFFWFSSTGWIMWNLWVSTLMTGAILLQFDGNPGHPDLDTLWRLAERERLTFMGISPAFVSLCMKAAMRPCDRFDISALRTIGSTGSPLTVEAYRWIYAAVHPDVMVASISGGTDPGAAFLTSCPILPVYAGEMQCRTLGGAIHAYSDDGVPMLGEVGELVCTQPMPSMPLRFWGDTDGRRYFESYFDTFPGPPNVWRHGDWLKLVPRPESVTATIYGRSDSTINRHGIRMGTSELYRVVEEFDEVADSLVVDLEYLGRESFLALFVVLRDAGSTAAGIGAKGPAPDGAAAARGQTGVSPSLRDRLLDALRTRLSARHVPNEVYAIPEVPRTMSGKKLEVPVRRILLGHPVEKSVNRDSMANPASIDWFVAFRYARTRAK
ncbi:MAG: acetoacetate--CoA ligase [Burkholderiaceae bacterium]|nr:acetoacetate--CoA ligase [Burkholderiaceae bacterium]